MCARVCVCVRAYVHVYVHAYMYACVYVQVRACTYIRNIRNVPHPLHAITTLSTLYTYINVSWVYQSTILCLRRSQLNPTGMLALIWRLFVLKLLCNRYVCTYRYCKGQITRVVYHTKCKSSCVHMYVRMYVLCVMSMCVRTCMCLYIVHHERVHTCVCLYIVRHDRVRTCVYVILTCVIIYVSLIPIHGS